MARINRLDRLTRHDRLGGLVQSVFGSTVARGFINDSIAGTDSLDVVVIGDSNAGRGYSGGGAGGGGHLRGIQRTLEGLGGSLYATSISPILTTLTVNSTPTKETLGVTKEDDNTTLLAPQGFMTQALIPTGGLTSGNAATSTIQNIIDRWKPVSTGNVQLRPLGVTGWNFAYIPTAYSDGSSAQVSTYPNAGGELVPVPALPAWCAAGTNLYYRFVHCRPLTNAGSITAYVWKGDGDFGVKKWDGVSQSTGTFQSGVGNTVNSATHVSQLEFKVPTGPTSGSRPSCVYGCTIAGSAAIFCQSVYNPNVTGFSCNSFHVGDGQSSTVIGNLVSNLGGGDGKTQFMATYLNETIARQNAVTGESRTLVVISFGMNDTVGGSASTITDNLTNTINEFRRCWIDDMGQGDTDSLAFLCVCGHPVDTDHPTSGKAAMLAGYMAAMNTWAADPAQVAKNITVVDPSRIYSAPQMTALGMYEGAGALEDHLSQAGYLRWWTGIINALRARA